MTVVCCDGSCSPSFSNYRGIIGPMKVKDAPKFGTKDVHPQTYPQCCLAHSHRSVIQYRIPKNVFYIFI